MNRITGKKLQLRPLKNYLQKKHPTFQFTPSNCYSYVFFPHCYKQIKYENYAPPLYFYKYNTNIE